MDRAGRVQGKVAIVTGAGSGIGRESAELLAREGARVVAADLDRESAEETVERILEGGGEAVASRTDVSREEEVVAMVATAVESWDRLDVLHNNAAMTAMVDHAHDADLLTMTVEYWDRSFAVNLRGAMLGCKHAIPVMIRSGGGSIVNMSSNQALSGDMSQFAYSAAKAGVNALTRSVATTYGARGVRCNTLSPGLILTPSALAACPQEVVDAIVASNLVPRAGQPLDLAQAVLFLASDDASFITGQTLSVDGGQLAHLPHFAYLKATGHRTTEER
ncbi:MAG: SDR family oxidoreductase [Deltaproteobacteria bacterium]|jgi:NAD(P)-dependent dehydrogenase (short-subunit alcohol dehydrogenase family)|nr:SDR family oxidoreductase [Deltaproteobacteria bacterium]MBW2500095.1 SDR family oxidoreductase [Deltaproteobacteria bacterium]